MKIELKASLEKTIYKWLCDISEDEFIPELGLFPPNLSEKMTKASAAVFDIAFEAQEYYIRENE